MAVIMKSVKRAHGRRVQSRAQYNGWDLDHVKEILAALCASYNDRQNREANIAVDV